MKTLTDHFDQVFIINCQTRADRLARLERHVKKLGLADWEKIIVQPAIIGDWTTVPADWCSGPGAWGCMRSHVNVLERALHARDEKNELRWKNYLVLEDDVFFLPDGLERLRDFMDAVPTSWGQIYLGGQHNRPPEGTDHPQVIVGRSVNRTHAYAVNSSHYTAVYRHLCYATDYRGNRHHVDHQLEIAHQRRDWPVYCPSTWLCGQTAGRSDISGKINKEELWQIT